MFHGFTYSWRCMVCQCGLFTWKEKRFFTISKWPHSRRGGVSLLSNGFLSQFTTRFDWCRVNIRTLNSKPSIQAYLCQTQLRRKVEKVRGDASDLEKTKRGRGEVEKMRKKWPMFIFWTDESVLFIFGGVCPYGQNNMYEYRSVQQLLTILRCFAQFFCFTTC